MDDRTVPNSRDVAKLAADRDPREHTRARDSGHTAGLVAKRTAEAIRLTFEAELREEELAAVRAELEATRAALDSSLLDRARMSTSRAVRIATDWASWIDKHPTIALWTTRANRMLILAIRLGRPRQASTHPLFDEDFYCGEYGVARSEALYDHYVTSGVRLGYDPNPWFDTDWYLSTYDDVHASGWNPLDHFYRLGWLEGRDPGPDFSTLDHLRRHPALVEAGINPLLHLMHNTAPGVGGREEATSLLGDGWSVEAPSPSEEGTSTVIPASSMESATPTAMGVTATFLSDAPQDTAPGTVLADLDLPDPGSEEAATNVIVAGWACAQSGIEAVEVWIDGEHAARTLPDGSRSDVGTSYPDILGSAQSGYSLDVPIHDLDPGEHRLVVEARSLDGGSWRTERVFVKRTSDDLYHRYFLRTQPTDERAQRIRDETLASGRAPKFIVFVEGTLDDLLWPTIASLARQGYSDLAVRVVPPSTNPGDASALWARCPDALLDAIQITSSWGAVDDSPGGPTYWCSLRAGEVLQPHALWRVAHTVVHGDHEVIYSDHDAVDEFGCHQDPVFCPDWSPDLLLSRDFVGGVYFSRLDEDARSALVSAASHEDTAWRHDMLLRIADRDARVAHIPEVLWSASAGTAGSEAGATGRISAVECAVARRGLEADVVPGLTAGTLRVQWKLERRPRVSIVVPTAGKREYLLPFVDSLVSTTEYPDYEVVFLDNSRGRDPDSIEFIRSRGFRVVERNEPYNWAKLNNDGARLADGEFLLFMNDDMEVIDPDWLDELVRQAGRPGVGPVGALLLYPSGNIQHAGIFLVNHGGGGMHWFHNADPSQPLYQGLHGAVREVTATTGACLMMRADRFWAIGGFDEALPIVGNDTEFCLRSQEHGLRTVWTPHCRLVHHENVSRSHYDIAEDERLLRSMYGSLLEAGDPLYNPNLTQQRTDCSIAWEQVKGVPEPPPGAVADGVNLVGYIRAEMGLGEATRGTARSLYAADVPFVVLDYSFGNPSRQWDHTWLHRVAGEPHFDVNVIQINGDHVEEAVRRLPERLLIDRYNIGIWAWELETLPDDWLPALDLLDEVWVPSRFVLGAVSRASRVPVHRLPHAVGSPSVVRADRARFGIPKGAYQFLVMYDKHSVAERKNPQGAIRAFCQAFSPGDDSVSLVVKVNNADAGGRDDFLASALDERTNIHLIEDVLSRAEVDSLIASSDCFVSLHRSEGFGLVIAEAMAMGKPVIATHWSGNADFMNPGNSACIEFRLVQIDEDYGPYERGQRWADPDLDQAADWMRRLHGDRALGARLGRSAAETIKDGYDPEIVGRMMRMRLRAIRAGRHDHTKKARLPFHQPTRSGG